VDDWLDTETKGILSGTPPTKLAPADTRAFTLIALSYRLPIDPRTRRAIRRIVGDEEIELKRCIGTMPRVIKSRLTHADALLGQFELICCNGVSVFLSDEVVRNAGQEYVDELFGALLSSPEFQSTRIRLSKIPDNERAEAFLDQFLDVAPAEYPADFDMPFKKARIMKEGTDHETLDGQNRRRDGDPLVALSLRERSGLQKPVGFVKEPSMSAAQPPSSMRSKRIQRKLAKRDAINPDVQLVSLHFLVVEKSRSCQDKHPLICSNSRC